MSIGTKVKKLRRERDMTQEQLADYLGISAKAISQWETDRTAPDISQIPILCNIFDITSDELLGIDVQNNEKRIEEMLSDLRKIAASGEHERAIEKAREGLVCYPNSFKLMLFFAEEIFLYNHMTPSEEQDINKDTALSYLEQILENCTDTSVRNKAHTTLCLWYAEFGRTEEAETLAKEKESSFTCGELLARIYKGTRRFEVLRDEVEGQFFHAVAYNFVGLVKSKYDDGTPVYSDDEKLAMYQTSIDMIKLFIPNKDYYFFAQFIESHYTAMAEICAKTQNREKTLEYLSEAAAYAAEFDCYDENAVHTSLALRSMVAGGVWWHDCHNRSYDLIAELRDERYAFLHGDSEFENIIERLSKTSK